MSSALPTGTLIELEFLSRVLKPYRDHCRYLKSVSIESDATAQDDVWLSLVAHGEFAIDQSCYIDDTGHFNAVEFNICYNQLAYVLLANCIRQEQLPALSSYTLETFFDKQLSNYLIANIDSSYHSQINPRRFYGEVRILSARSRGKLAILRTSCHFRDDYDGHSSGEVKLAILHP